MAEACGGSRRLAAADGSWPTLMAPPAPMAQDAPMRGAQHASWPTPPARELGDLFEYRIAQPVTIRKNESAMLPFLQQTIEARKLLIYSDHSSQHPTNAAELTNSTRQDARRRPDHGLRRRRLWRRGLMETLKAGDKRLISYAVDLGTRITEAFGSKQAIVREIHANRGMLTTKSPPRRPALTPSATSTRRPRR